MADTEIILDEKECRCIYKSSKTLGTVIQVCVIKTSFSRSSKKNEAKLEGNVMIERILHADRFDELVDKIVSKTLEKLKHETSMLPDSIKTNKAVDPVIAKSVLRKSKKAHKSKVPKIDANAVLQKKVLPLNELIFRYDHFTKNPDTSSKKTHSKINDNNKKKQKTNKADKKGTKEKPQLDSNEKSDKDISKSQENSDSKKHKQTDLSSENMTFNTKLQNESGEMRFGNDKQIIWGNTDKRSEETINLDKSMEEQPTIQKKGLKPKKTNDIHLRASSIEQETNENNDKQQKDDENQTDEAQTKENSKQVENQSTSIKLPDNTEGETIAISLGTVPVHSGERKDNMDEKEILIRASDKDLMENEGEETNVKQPLDQSDMKSDDETDALKIKEAQHEEKKRILRKEGDKWFAMEESPDYAEYHEQLSKMRKSLNKDHEH